MDCPYDTGGRFVKNPVQPGLSAAGLGGIVSAVPLRELEVSAAADCILRSTFAGSTRSSARQQKSRLTAHAWYPCVSKESSKRHRGTAPSDSARQSELRFTALPVLPAALEFRLETQLCHGEFCSFLVWY